VIETGSRTEPLTSLLPRLAAAYRSMPQSKLLGKLADGRSRAQTGYVLAAEVAVAAQGVEERDRAEPPRWRVLPFDGPFLVGDQIAVTSHDLMLATATATAVVVASEPAPPVAADVMVWTADGSRVPLDQLLAAVLASATALAEAL
jgi:hypothetical protein